MLLFAECTQFIKPQNGNISVSENGTLAEFSCKEGYTLIGDPELHCTSTLNPILPSCGRYSKFLKIMVIVN